MPTNEQLLQHYREIDSTKMEWNTKVLAAMYMDTERPTETEEENFQRIQKEFICDLLLFGMGLELVDRGYEDYRSKAEYHFKEMEGNIRYKFPKQDLYIVANILLGNQFANWGQQYMSGKPKLFWKIKDMVNLEYWLAIWINICCDMNEYPMARYLASNAKECLQYYKNASPSFMGRLDAFLDQ